MPRPRDGSVVLTLHFVDVDRPPLGDVSSFIYDFELLHDLYLILLSERYHDFEFSRFFWFRNGRKIRPEDRIREVRIANETPLELVVEIIGGTLIASGVAYAILRNIESIYSIRRTSQQTRHDNERHDLDMEERKLRIENLRRRGRIAIQDSDALVIWPWSKMSPAMAKEPEPSQFKSERPRSRGHARSE